MADCFIVAGGSSLLEFDWGYLDDKRNVFAINRSYEKCTKADNLFWVDERFWSVHEKGLTEHNAPNKITARRHPMRIDYPDWVTQYNFSGQKGYDEKDGFIRTGNNSGYACLSLAIQQGFREIFLLGYDMKFESQSHWHDGHTDVRGNKLVNLEETLTDKMLPFFDGLKEATSHIAGLRIINTNPNSAIQCFEFGELP